MMVNQRIAFSVALKRIIIWGGGEFGNVSLVQHPERFYFAGEVVDFNIKLHSCWSCKLKNNQSTVNVYSPQIHVFYINDLNIQVTATEFPNQRLSSLMALLITMMRRNDKLSWLILRASRLWRLAWAEGQTSRSFTTLPAIRIASFFLISTHFQLSAPSRTSQLISYAEVWTSWLHSTTSLKQSFGSKGFLKFLLFFVSLFDVNSFKICSTYYKCSYILNFKVIETTHDQYP